MRVALWVITDGEHMDRVDRLLKSCAPRKVKVLCYGKNPGSRDFTPESLACDIAEDTYFTSNFNRILAYELKGDYKANFCQGDTYITDNNSDAVLIMNDDIEWQEGSLERLLTFADDNEFRWGTINPAQVSFSNPNLVIMGGTGSCYPSGMHLQYALDAELKNYVTTWPWVPFCAPLISLDAVRAIGMLDPALRMWCSDTDWCMRARWGKYDIIILNDCFVNHEEHGTIESTGREELFNGDSGGFHYKWNNLFSVFAKTNE